MQHHSDPFSPFPQNFTVLLAVSKMFFKVVAKGQNLSTYTTPYPPPPPYFYETLPSIYSSKLEGSPFFIRAGLLFSANKNFS